MSIMKKRKATVMVNAILIFSLAMLTISLVSKSLATSLSNYDRLDVKTQQQISDEVGNEHSLKFLMYENA